MKIDDASWRRPGKDGGAEAGGEFVVQQRTDARADHNVWIGRGRGLFFVRLGIEPFDQSLEQVCVLNEEAFHGGRRVGSSLSSQAPQT